MQGYFAIPTGGIGHSLPNTPTSVHLRRPQYFGPEPTVESHHAPGRKFSPLPQRSPPTTPPTPLVRILSTTPVIFLILLNRFCRPSLPLYSNSKMFCPGYLQITNVVSTDVTLSYVAPSSRGLFRGECSFFCSRCSDSFVCLFLFLFFIDNFVYVTLSNLRVIYSQSPSVTTPLCASTDGKRTEKKAASVTQ